MTTAPTTSDAASAGIVVSGLAKTFIGAEEDVHAVRGIDFEVRPGEIFGLLGPNGAGKTTTLRMLATLLAPSAGTITVAGHDAATAAESVREAIGFQTGSTGVYDRLTPREMIAYFGRLHGLDEGGIASRVEALVAQFQMTPFADRLCGRLSTGQKQKVSIARTVVHDPSVLIFDEPLAGLDVIVARTVIAFIRQARDDGKALILSTHRLELAEAECDRVAIIYDGRLLGLGTPAELAAAHGGDRLEQIFFTLTERHDAGAKAAV